MEMGIRKPTTVTARPLMIISMKGHPGTGKSTLAHKLANLLSYPLIDKDDIKNSTYALQSHLPSHTLLNDMSYAAMWNVAATQLKLGLSVIVDAPLSRPEYFDKLAQVAEDSGARVAVVECRPRDWEEWRRRLERRGAEEGAVWHKPAKWEEIERLLDGYDGCYEYEVPGKVAKVVVDTTAPFSVDHIVDFILGNKDGGHLELPSI
uniref:P-loop containing nucleoside triphosphate hydrolase protein n=1 Tax=Kalanchoe fedtschenkoi TaxID=63787 RepID=A0A7N0UCV5_KALFE